MATCVIRWEIPEAFRIINLYLKYINASLLTIAWTRCRVQTQYCTCETLCRAINCAVIYFRDLRPHSALMCVSLRWWMIDSRFTPLLGKGSLVRGMDIGCFLHYLITVSRNRSPWDPELPSRNYIYMYVYNRPRQKIHVSITGIAMSWKQANGYLETSEIKYKEANVFQTTVTKLLKLQTVIIFMFSKSVLRSVIFTREIISYSLCDLRSF